MSDSEPESAGETEPETTRRKVKSDEAWKDRVRSEAADPEPQQKPGSALDNQTPAAEPDAAADDVDAGSAPLPPPSFEMLVQMFSTQAMVALGLLGDPEEGASGRSLPLARHFIDLLGMLEQKTRGNLSPSEDRALQSALHYLRMTFIEQSRAPA